MIQRCNVRTGTAGHLAAGPLVALYLFIVLFGNVGGACIMLLNTASMAVARTLGESSVPRTHGTRATAKSWMRLRQLWLSENSPRATRQKRSVHGRSGRWCEVPRARRLGGLPSCHARVGCAGTVSGSRKHLLVLQFDILSPLLPRVCCFCLGTLLVCSVARDERAYKRRQTDWGRSRSSAVSTSKVDKMSTGSLSAERCVWALLLSVTHSE
jgi:hypothetical protein